MNEIYQYQGYLSTFHSGEIVKINIKTLFYSENIDYTMTIVDSDDKELSKLKKCAAIVVTKSYSNDFIYITKEGNMQLCHQVNCSRLMLIRPNSFNFDSVNEIKEKVNPFILLFKFHDCVDQSIPILLMTDNREDKYEVYNNQSKKNINFLR